MSRTKNRLFSCLGCFVAGPLGCLSFASGAAVVAVVFAPQLLGDLFAREAPLAFGDAYEGELVVGELDLSWTQRQVARDVALYDPEGRLVVQATVEGPSLWELASGEERLSDLVVRGEVRIVADGSGRTNLDRALARRDEPESERGAETSLHFNLDSAGERSRIVDVDLAESARSWSSCCRQDRKPS